MKNNAASLSEAEKRLLAEYMGGGSSTRRTPAI